MAGQTFTNWAETYQPRWAVDYKERPVILPGGAKLVAASFTADAAGRRFVPAGTLIGRTFAERTAGTGFGPWVTGDSEVYLVLHDVYDAALNNDVDLYHGRVKENHLPGFDTLAADALAAIRANFRTTIGAA